MIRRYLKRDNPWELLVFAAMLFIPGLVLVLQKPAVTPPAHLVTAAQFNFRRYIVGLSSSGAHILVFRQQSNGRRQAPSLYG
jgi:hypothetical protein